MNQDMKKILITGEEIQMRCGELGKQISEDYTKAGSVPLLVGLLRGSVPFMAELIKHLSIDAQYDFMDVTSYAGTKSTGDIKIIKDLDTSIEGLDILLVEDIVDTGKTIQSVKSLMYNKGARSVKVVTLLDKPARREVKEKAEYVGFSIENEFVVGFGMDFNQHYRCLPYIGVLKDELYA
jgi:hypoxanthine phosphoribosyltransferase